MLQKSKSLTMALLDSKSIEPVNKNRTAYSSSTKVEKTAKEFDSIMEAAQESDEDESKILQSSHKMNRMDSKRVEVLENID